MPTKVSGAQGRDPTFLEAVWNVYALRDNKTVLDPGLGLTVGGASDGGVDTDPADAGLPDGLSACPTSANPDGGTGRALPTCRPTPAATCGSTGRRPWRQDRRPISGTIGAPAPRRRCGLRWRHRSTPCSTTRAAQSRLRQRPALPSRRPSRLRRSTTSFSATTRVHLPTGRIHRRHGIRCDHLTGFGYNAGPSYDPTTGLGSPMADPDPAPCRRSPMRRPRFADSPPVLDGTDGWTMGATQNLLVQTISATIDPRDRGRRQPPAARDERATAPLRLDRQAGAAVFAGGFRCGAGAPVRWPSAGCAHAGAGGARHAVCRDDRGRRPPRRRSP